MASPVPLAPAGGLAPLYPDPYGWKRVHVVDPRDRKRLLEVLLVVKNTVVVETQATPDQYGRHPLLVRPELVSPVSLASDDSVGAVVLQLEVRDPQFPRMILEYLVTRLFWNRLLALPLPDIIGFKCYMPRCIITSKARENLAKHFPNSHPGHTYAIDNAISFKVGGVDDPSHYHSSTASLASAPLNRGQLHPHAADTDRYVLPRNITTAFANGRALVQANAPGGRITIIPAPATDNARFSHCSTPHLAVPGRSTLNTTTRATQLSRPVGPGPTTKNELLSKAQTTAANQSSTPNVFPEAAAQILPGLHDTAVGGTAQGSAVAGRASVDGNFSAPLPAGRVRPTAFGTIPSHMPLKERIQGKNDLGLSQSEAPASTPQISFNELVQQAVRRRTLAMESGDLLDKRAALRVFRIDNFRLTDLGKAALHMLRAMGKPPSEVGRFVWGSDLEKFGPVHCGDPYVANETNTFPQGPPSANLSFERYRFGDQRDSLLGRYYTNAKFDTPALADGHERYCICNEPQCEDGRLMIQCSNEAKCRMQWFHISCIKMAPDQVPASPVAWFCDECVIQKIGKVRTMQSVGQLRNPATANSRVTLSQLSTGSSSDPMDRSLLAVRSLRGRRNAVPPLSLKPATGMTISKPSPFDLKPWTSDLTKSFTKDNSLSKDFNVTSLSDAKQAVLSRPALNLPASAFKSPPPKPTLTSPPKSVSNSHGKSWTIAEEQALVEVMNVVVNHRRLLGEEAWAAAEKLMHARGIHRKVGGMRMVWCRGLREQAKIDERRRRPTQLFPSISNAGKKAASAAALRMSIPNDNLTGAPVTDDAGLARKLPSAGSFSQFAIVDGDEAANNSQAGADGMGLGTTRGTKRRQFSTMTENPRAKRAARRVGDWEREIAKKKQELEDAKLLSLAVKKPVVEGKHRRNSF